MNSARELCVHASLLRAIEKRRVLFCPHCLGPVPRGYWLHSTFRKPKEMVGICSCGKWVDVLLEKKQEQQ